MRVPMQGLTAFTGADFRAPGGLYYTNFLRATQYCCNDVREKAAAFKRIVFNNRDDHPKNLAYLMSPGGQWKLPPGYDVTFCEGPGGYQQMDVMGEVLHVTRKHLLTLTVEEAEQSGPPTSSSEPVSLRQDDAGSSIGVSEKYSWQRRTAAQRPCTAPGKLFIVMKELGLNLSVKVVEGVLIASRSALAGPARQASAGRRRNLR